jgi:hypothetical protein
VGRRSRRIAPGAAPFGEQVAAGLADAHLVGQVAVGGPHVDGQGVRLGQGRVELQVHQADLGLVARALPGRHRLALAVPVASGRFALAQQVVVLQRVEGLEGLDGFAFGGLVHAVDLVDRIDLVAEGPAPVRQHRVERLVVGDADRVGAGGEQVDDRGAAQHQVARAHQLQQAAFVAVGAQAGQGDVDRQAAAGRAQAEAGSGRSTKLNLSAKAKYSVSRR